MTTPRPKVRERQAERQMRVLAFIQAFIRNHRYAPTIREICVGCDLLSTNTATEDLNALAYQGYLTRDPRIPRSIVLTTKGVLA